jgi:hypothetical protein
MMNRVLATLWLAAGFSFFGTTALLAQAPLHQRIDQAMAAGQPNFEAKAAPLASDAEFLRRVTLDLTGALPSTLEIRAFLKDAAADKRTQVIDRLLASPDHIRHMENVFDVLLMERRPARLVTQAQWRDYLRTSVAANKPWDQMVSEVLSADGADPKLRAAAAFYLERGGEPHLITRDISRLFLGTNLQCAQCHDHPRVRHYKQDHYYGIYAFLNRSYLFTDKKTRQSIFAEKADGEVTYLSVFDPAKVTKSAGPRMPHRPLVKDPLLEKGKEYVVAPTKDIRGVPKYSRRAQLAGELTSAETAQFRRNITNRLWAMMMGRGLVHPVEWHHADNPASHPELLDQLADDLMARKYDMRALLRELALSKTYQRSSEMPAGMKDVAEDSFAVAHLKPLSAEQLAWALLEATGMTDAERVALGKNLTPPALDARLAAQARPIIATFAGPAGQPDNQTFQATINQALFVRNGSVVQAMLTARPGSLMDRLGKLKEADEVSEELYLSVLTRLPSAEERREVADLLKARPNDRAAVVKDLAWALLASAEFRFNH